MQLSNLDLFIGPISWRELFAYVINRHAMSLLTEYHVRGKLIAPKKIPLKKRIRTLAECASWRTPSSAFTGNVTLLTTSLRLFMCVYIITPGTEMVNRNVILGHRRLIYDNSGSHTVLCRPMACFADFVMQCAVCCLVLHINKTPENAHTSVKNKVYKRDIISLS